MGFHFDTAETEPHRPKSSDWGDFINGGIRHSRLSGIAGEFILLVSVSTYFFVSTPLALIYMIFSKRIPDKPE
jgi:hypothetical protein